jgi:N-acetyl-gamma-glutamyl-phosphate reductase
MPSVPGSSPRVGLLHGAGYVGGELVRLLNDHPACTLAAVTSRTFAGEPLHTPHAHLRGRVSGAFIAPDALDLSGLDGLVIAAEHGRTMHLVPDLRNAGFDGPIVDLSSDFRFATADAYEAANGQPHAAPEWIGEAHYRIPEVTGPLPAEARFVANPGCFATALTLALAPLAAQDVPLTASVTALTGASGSGASPSSATHFPDRDGNVRAYKVLQHRHAPEVVQTLGDHVQVNFVPVSGPWTRGIWATAQVEWPAPVDADTVAGWFADAYADAPLVRCSPDALPELKPVARTPFGDVGWQVHGRTVVVGVALDNLLKGAASQAVQNLNHLLGLPDALGLLATTNAPTT